MPVTQEDINFKNIIRIFASSTDLKVSPLKKKIVRRNFKHSSIFSSMVLQKYISFAYLLTSHFLNYSIVDVSPKRKELPFLVIFGYPFKSII